MKQHERAQEFAAAAARLRVNSDWKVLKEMLQSLMDEFDDILRRRSDHEELIRAQAGRRQLQELIDFVDNARSPDTRQRTGQGFGN